MTTDRGLNEILKRCRVGNAFNNTTRDWIETHLSLPRAAMNSTA